MYDVCVNLRKITKSISLLHIMWELLIFNLVDTFIDINVLVSGVLRKDEKYAQAKSKKSLPRRFIWQWIVYGE